MTPPMVLADNKHENGGEDPVKMAMANSSTVF